MTDDNEAGGLSGKIVNFLFGTVLAGLVATGFTYKSWREQSQARGRVCKIMIVALARKLPDCFMALRQGWRHSGGGDDESIRTTFIATSLLVKDRRSPSIPQDPEQGAVSQSGAAARTPSPEYRDRVGMANPTGYEVGEESLAATNWSSLATRNEEQFRCLTTKPPYEGNRNPEVSITSAK